MFTVGLFKEELVNGFVQVFQWHQVLERHSFVYIAKTFYSTNI